MTPLGRFIAEVIEQNGPMPVSRYMALCLGHPGHGYYMTRDPLGRAGDFTTAPEISQMFGEMLGVWAMSVWQAMGRPAPFRLVELGPGRGTLMADALRAGRALPGFRQAARVHLVEISPVLRKAQQGALAQAGVPVAWHGDASDVPEGPALVFANEFFDALPIRQFVRSGGGWRERLVGLEGEALAFGLGPATVAAPSPPADAPEGAVRETCPDGLDVMAALAGRIAAQGGALLAIDYGYARPGFGDSLQAMAGHAFVDPLAASGEADLTAHVDFSALANAARRAGASVHPLLTQRGLLRRLGVEARAAALAKAQPARAGEIEAALARLIGPGEGAMGTLFKALAIASPGLTPPAFDTPDPLIETMIR